MADKPKNMVTLLRQLAEKCQTPAPISDYPEWFQEEWNKDPGKAWSTIVFSAADELEQMQKLNGRLYKTLYGGN